MGNVDFKVIQQKSDWPWQLIDYDIIVLIYIQSILFKLPTIYLNKI